MTFKGKNIKWGKENSGDQPRVHSSIIIITHLLIPSILCPFFLALLFGINFNPG